MISVDDIKDRAGIPLTDPFDDSLISDCIAAGYAFMAEARPDRDWTAPTPSERLGLVWLVSRFYQELGRTDSTVDSIEGAVPLIGRQANQLLGLGYYAPPVVA